MLGVGVKIELQKDDQVKIQKGSKTNDCVSEFGGMKSTLLKLLDRKAQIPPSIIKADVLSGFFFLNSPFKLLYSLIML